MHDCEVDGLRLGVRENQDVQMADVFRNEVLPFFEVFLLLVDLLVLTVTVEPKTAELLLCVVMTRHVSWRSMCFP